MKNRNSSNSDGFTAYFSAASLLIFVFALHSTTSKHVVLALASRSASTSDLWSSSKERYSFGVNGVPFLRRSENRRSIGLFSSNANDGTDGEENETNSIRYPALSREEIDAWLSSVEVYALMTTGGEDSSDERIHLLYGPDGSAVTYFFISSEAAGTMASQLKEMGGGDLSTTALSLGKVWFGLLDPRGADRVEGVDYRLVPDPRDLNGAKLLLTDSTSTSSSCTFESPFNEIPTFLDVRMRIPGSEVVDDVPVEQLPVYLGLQNIIQASENMKAAEDPSSSLSSAAINVADLNDLVKQMQQESIIDFRRSVLVPPTNM